jgi:DNA polymerase-3 subunit alpha
MSSLTGNFKKYDLNIKGVRLPSFDIPDQEKSSVGVKKDCNNLTFLTALCQKGLSQIKGTTSEEKYKKYTERTEYELKILDELSFVDYILLVWDVINFCKKEGVATGMGRGSAAGSLVLYLIGVTRINPIINDLYFERFVSKVRAKKQVVDGITYLDGELMADIDLDICYYERDKVLKFFL